MVYCTLKYKSNILIKINYRQFICNNLCICPRYLHKKVWTNPLSGYVYIIYIYQWMSVQFFLHILNKKFWLQFICNKLISTTAHESVKIISTKWFMHISHLISVNISRELWYIFFVWSFSVTRFLRPLLKHLMSVRTSVRSSVHPSVRFLQSATPLTVTTHLIDLNYIMYLKYIVVVHNGF